MPLLVAACYLPPAGSPQLEQVSHEEWLATLGERMAIAAAEGSVMVAGDFNAHVGPVGCAPYDLNPHGRGLRGVCADTGFTLCTGCVEGDHAALPTFPATNAHSATRPDHILASPAARQWLSSCRVLPDRRGSDHLPLDTLLTLPWAPRTAPPVDGTALPRARWDHHLLWEYSTALREEALAAACAAAAAGDSIEALYLAAGGGHLGSHRQRHAAAAFSCWPSPPDAAALV
ncbi:hypothetical protein WJX81_007096 [Elliptochloris bilobata]|uniref:Endonuclease/exonuclease/phosphatase domain-containing protein n=1 Tax=Elliptochloris bilobata TaxID=381761 RepID=A0AAW1RGB9_9CHLO